uniref:NADH-ubiquinone oxidoreductase chain 6 n=1 Tax=Glaucidium brasilianum TaxID=78217 RepID=A0A7L8DDB1_GLABR|nr:NADH dehydrogenase subunit 6 [Glaucidium brasilianum]
MTYFVVFSGVGLVLGGLAVASNPSPHYGILGLVLGSLSGCGWLLNLGVSFVSLVLFVVYLGGMLVVFVYSVALAADPFPEAWGDWRVLGRGLGLVLMLVVGVGVSGVAESWGFVNCGGTSVVQLDCGGVSVFYSWGAGMFMAAGWGLLLTLFVVMELVRGLSRGAIRAV